MKTKQHKLWVKIGRVAFTCNTIEEAASRVNLFFQNWYESGLCSQSDKSDWNIWSNRRNKMGSRKHVANIQFGEIAPTQKPWLRKVLDDAKAAKSKWPKWATTHQNDG